MKWNSAIRRAIVIPALLICALPAFGQDAREWFLQGNSLSSQGRFEEAVEAYRQSIDLNPSAVAYYNLGIAYKRLNRLEESASAFEKTVELEPFNLDARYSLGNVYNLQERWGDAIGQLNVVVHLRRNDAGAHGNLGWAYYNYRDGPPFKLLVILNLQKAVTLFEEQNNTQAADATRKVLEEAKSKFGYPERP